MKPKPIVFEGRTFASQADWIREYPLYKAFVEDLKTGADTVMEMEKRIAARRRVARIKSRESAQRQNQAGKTTTRKVRT